MLEFRDDFNSDEYKVERGLSFGLGITQYLFNYKDEELKKKLHAKIYSVKKTGISYRVINNWDENELIDDDRETTKEWRKFSLLELTWIRCIAKLRDFGISTEHILKVKNSLQRKGLLFESDGTKLLVNYLEYFFVLCMIDYGQCNLLVFDDGKADLLTQKQFKNNLQVLSDYDFLLINLNKLIKKEVNPEKFIESENSNVLAPVEKDILKTIRDAEYDYIEIIKSNGSVSRIKATEYNKPVSLSSLKKELEKGDFQDLVIRQRNGSIVSLNRKFQKKF